MNLKLPDPSLQIVAIARRLGADVKPKMLWWYGQLNDLAGSGRDHLEVLSVASMVSMEQGSRILADANREEFEVEAAGTIGGLIRYCVRQWAEEIVQELHREKARARFAEEQQHAIGP